MITTNILFFIMFLCIVCPNPITNYNVLLSIFYFTLSSFSSSSSSSSSTSFSSFNRIYIILDHLWKRQTCLFQSPLRVETSSMPCNQNHPHCRSCEGNAQPRKRSVFRLSVEKEEEEEEEEEEKDRE